MKSKRFNVTCQLFLMVIVILAISFMFCIKSEASTAATYFYGEPILIEDKENIELISDVINIDVATSKVENTFLIKNTSNKEIKTKASIQLENKDLSTTIKNLEIVMNDLKLEHVEEKKEYIHFL